MECRLPRSRERAQSLVEFALVLPLFLVLMVGIMDFSRFLLTYASLANGTRELARTASLVNATSAQVVDVFNTTAFIVASPPTSGDTLVMCVFDRPSAATAACPPAGGSPAPLASATCTLPLTVAGCTPPSRAIAGADFVMARTTYAFHFTPGLEDLLNGLGGVGLTLTPMTIQTVTAAQIES